MPRVITIDIETLPAYEDADTGVQYAGANKATDEYLRTALNGDFGRILCIGYYDEGRADRPARRGCLGWSKEHKRFGCDEREMLQGFWEMMRGFRSGVDRIIGHNIFDFDLKFIYKRSIINGVKPTIELSFARYRCQPIFDTMHEWERWSYGSRISLDRLACVLRLPSSKEDGIDGSRVFECFKAGEHEMIRDYCLRDVALTRAIYRRMVFPGDQVTCSQPLSRSNSAVNRSQAPAAI